jgi:hypothetical protein
MGCDLRGNKGGPWGRDGSWVASVRSINNVFDPPPKPGSSGGLGRF